MGRLQCPGQRRVVQGSTKPPGYHSRPPSSIVAASRCPVRAPSVYVYQVLSYTRGVIEAHPSKDKELHRDLVEGAFNVPRRHVKVTLHLLLCLHSVHDLQHRLVHDFASDKAVLSFVEAASAGPPLLTYRISTEAHSFLETPTRDRGCKSVSSGKATLGIESSQRHLWCSGISLSTHIALRHSCIGVITGRGAILSML